MSYPSHTEWGESKQRHTSRILYTGLPSDLSVDSFHAELKARGCKAMVFATGPDLFQEIRKTSPDLILVGPQNDSPSEALDMASEIKHIYPNIAIVVLARNGSQMGAIRALREGLQDYIPLPCSQEEVVRSLLRCLSANQPSLCGRNGTRGRADDEAQFVGVCPSIALLQSAIDRLAQTNATVLIRGETGTGKDVVASLIHARSDRRRHLLVPLNCAAIPDSLLESELFGYQRGAFTGADSSYEGKLQQANGGTVFLDEIGDMSLQAQAKLLRVIESKQMYRLGGKAPLPLDVRILAATNQDLERMMADGTFRKDLFYRLNVASIHVPPLRDRRADIPVLVEHFIRFFNLQYRRRIKSVSHQALEQMVRAPWHGNVRELKSCVELAVLNCEREDVLLEHLPKNLHNRSLHNAVKNRQSYTGGEESRLLSVLTETRWNVAAAARQLQWSRMTLYRKMSKYRLSKRLVF